MKILIGGSPCTHWSIAQTKNRETEASGVGWELFLNYRIARDKYAVQTTQHNYPETVQLGDAFQVRKEDWTL
jgi:site-specific DNA-cytosine methylase|nr:MAG TPA_asm: DNA (cytosine-5)-methyltransferase 3A [Caudoviricetes sp.]